MTRAMSPADTVTSLPPRAAGDPAEPVGDKTVHWRRRLAYALMIGYALLMFVPFAWTVITSLKTLPDSERLTLIPDPLTFAPWQYIFTNLQPNIIRLFLWLFMGLPALREYYQFVSDPYVIILCRIFVIYLFIIFIYCG